MKLKGVNRAHATAGAGAEQQTETQGGVHVSEQHHLPATQGANALAPQAGSIQALNNGVLENIADMQTESTSFVSFAGGQFYFKASEEFKQEIVVQIVKGKRIFQKYDDVENRYITSETKIDNSYKFKFQVYFVLADPTKDPNDEAQTYLLTLPTASAMQFVNYVKRLAKEQGLGVDKVRTKMWATHQVNKDKQHYSRVAFEALDLYTGKPLGVIQK